MFKLLHSGISFLVITLLIFTLINVFVKLKSKENYQKNDYLIALITVFAVTIQFILGMVSFYFSTYYETLKQAGFKVVMKDSTLRLYIIEHPLMMIIGAILIIIGFYKHQKKKDDILKFKTLAWYFGVGFLLILSRIPWEQWFKNQ